MTHFFHMVGLWEYQRILLAVFDEFSLTEQNLLMVAKDNQEDEPSMDPHESEGYDLDLLFELLKYCIFFPFIICCSHAQFFLKTPSY